MFDMLNDLMQHTASLGFFENLRVIGTDDSTTFEAVDEDKIIILNGSFKTPVPEFKGEFGIGDLSRLTGYLNHTNFKDAAAKIEVVKQMRNGKEVPVTIKFINKPLNSAVEHRLMDAAMVSEARFLGKEWDVVVKPAKAKLSEFSSFATLELTHDEYFMPKVENHNLMIYFGEPNSSTHSASMEFEKNVKGALSQQLYWKTNIANQVFKLGYETGITLSIVSKGALQIAMETEFAEFRFVCRAHKK